MDEYYQRYKLPHKVYMETLWFIRQYQDKKDEVDAIINGTPEQDGQPKGSGTGDPTGMKAARISELQDDIRLIEKALSKVPEEYQRSILANIIDRTPYPDVASEKTWKRWRHRFIYYVAMMRRSV